MYGRRRGGSYKVRVTPTLYRDCNSARRAAMSSSWQSAQRKACSLRRSKNCGSVSNMPLPATKGDLNRLGHRLIASDRIVPADLEQLAFVLSAYQQVLDRVKTQLRDLGLSATGRVKTTKTLTDKLRRIHGFELSRMQDLAGARIVVSDLRIQNEVTEKIREFYESQGCACRFVDRRADPRFGYRAVHLIVRVDGIPIEIQVRTELQDAWAQIVERLADRWGRGIRYGEDPEDPEAQVRYGARTASRREAVERLMELSETSAPLEQNRASVVSSEKTASFVEEGIAELQSVAQRDPELLDQKISVRLMEHLNALRDILADSDEPVDQALFAAGAETTLAQLIRACELAFARVSEALTTLRKTVEDHEGRLRGILQEIANARDEGA